MKQLLILVIAFCTSFAAFAQPKNVNQANTAFTKKEYAEAATLIEPAITDEKTAEKGRTWYIRGEIYSAIALSTDEAVKAIDKDALVKAAQSYEKVMEIEKEGSSYAGLALIGLDRLRSGVLNGGVSSYQSNDYEGAMNAFQDYTKIAPEDTTGYIYSALMAQQLEDYQTVVDNYKKCFELDYYPKTAFTTIVYYDLNQLDNPEDALEVVKLAQEKYPEDVDFQKTAVDVYIKLDKIDEAIAELNHAIESEPANARLHANLGMLYDSQEKMDLAVEEYKKALEIDPNDRFSLINMAVYYINSGDKINHKAIDMDMATFRKEGAKLEEAAKEQWLQAIPYLERVMAENDTDELALQNLHAVYYKLKDGPNAKKIEARRRELGYIVD